MEKNLKVIHTCIFLLIYRTTKRADLVKPPLQSIFLDIFDIFGGENALNSNWKTYKIDCKLLWILECVLKFLIFLRFLILYFFLDSICDSLCPNKPFCTLGFFIQIFIQSLEPCKSSKSSKTRNWGTEPQNWFFYQFGVFTKFLNRNSEKNECTEKKHVLDMSFKENLIKFSNLH